MIDIHCHLLYGVDDGAKTIEESVAMLEAAKEQGISAMILTPHYRHGMFAYPKEEIEEHFRILEPYAQKLGIYLALGTEYHVNSHIVEALDSVFEVPFTRIRILWLTVCFKCLALLFGTNW